MSASKTLNIIDTNVIIEAGKTDRNLSESENECAEKCADFLIEWNKNPDSVVVVDDDWEILGEYERVINREYSKAELQKNAVGAFWRILFQRMNEVNLQRTGENEYAVFPADPALDEFDPPDKKFIAAACAHPEHPPVVEGTDCKWLKYRDALSGHGVRIEFLCPEYIRANYRHKFPGEEPPEL